MEALLMSTSCKEKIEQKNILRYLCDEHWSNAACCGYMIFACENLGYSKEQINHLLSSMQDVFNQKTIKQAKQRFYR